MNVGFPIELQMSYLDMWELRINKPGTRMDADLVMIQRRELFILSSMFYVELIVLLLKNNMLL